MAEVINMPRLSDTMEEGTVAQWLVKVGDKISEGDILAEIETDKATMEFESFYNGVLLHIGLEEGESAPVDSLLAIIGEEGEDISELLEGKSETSDKAEEEEDPKDSDNEESEDEEDAETKDSEDGENEDEETTEESDTSQDIPEGVQVITMPRLSDTMEEGTVAQWLKKEGDTVEEGDILAEIETDKATMEFESFYTGTLLKIGIQEGESAEVDKLLAILGPEGTDVSEILKNFDQNKEKDSVKAAPKKEKKPAKTEAKATKKTASKPAAATKKATKPSASDKRIFISPLARKLAEERNINLKHIQPTGDNSRIIKRDIENYHPGAPADGFVPVGEETWEETKNSQMRKTIAKRLGESKFTAPHYYLTVELDMDNAISARTAINENAEQRVSFNDMVIKACAMALRKHPQVNTQWKDDVTITAKHIHIGVAVAVDEGLVVPVLPFADQMSFLEIGSDVRELAGKAKDKKLTPQEMQGSTFTVSNLGMFGIKDFTSIINQPNSAILSVGAIVQQPVVKNGEIVVGNRMTVTLACDHRTVDGATGAKFLQTLRGYIENPITMFV